mmetsp:Transcript_13903/g.29703  ORF Transcript_13903/g.29703 Transcript_13903/m.29703 type:complete len:213 (+) Transcript_13903:446-1084(+)
MSAFSKPMVGKFFANASTLALRASISGHCWVSTAARKSFSFGPVFSRIICAMPTASSTNSTTCSKSFSVKPRVVRAGVPMRTPPGTRAETSPGTVFLLAAMCTSSSTRSTRDPSTPLGRRSTSTRWLSVPPETSLKPFLSRASAIALLFFSTCTWYSLNSGVAACFSATARPAMVWLWGPPWRPGKTEKLILSSMSYMISLPFLSTFLRPLR